MDRNLSVFIIMPEYPYGRAAGSGSFKHSWFCDIIQMNQKDMEIILNLLIFLFGLIIGSFCSLLGGARKFNNLMRIWVDTRFGNDIMKLSNLLFLQYDRKTETN